MKQNLNHNILFERWRRAMHHAFAGYGLCFAVTDNGDPIGFGFWANARPPRADNDNDRNVWR